MPDASDRHSDAFITEQAEHVLRQHFASEIRLRPVKAFRHSPYKRFSAVRRCAVEGDPGAPKTVIVKKVREDNASPYDPDSPTPSEVTHGFFADWAALALFSQIPHDPPILPAFYGGDRDAGIIVMEDLGDESNSLGQILAGDDPERASEALAAYMRDLGRFNALSIGWQPTHHHLLQQLGPLPTAHELYDYPWEPARLRATPAAEIDTAIAQYRKRFAALGIEPAQGVDAEIALITAQILDSPGPYLSLCQGDQNGVGGFMLRPGGSRMYDFDTAGFRHALLEGMPHRLTWGGMTRLPNELTAMLDRAYRETFAQGCPLATDDARYDRAMAEAGGYWHIFHTVDRLQSALELAASTPLHEERMRGPSTLRQQILAWTDAFANLAEEKDQLPALARSARDLATRLRNYWPAEVGNLPIFSAFAR